MESMLPLLIFDGVLTAAAALMLLGLWSGGGVNRPGGGRWL